jgi:hypothetical protein
MNVGGNLPKPADAYSSRIPVPWIPLKTPRRFLDQYRDGAVIDRPELFYWRTATGEEVDFVVARGTELIGVEVQVTARPRAADWVHLRTFRDEYGDIVRGCLFPNGGDKVEWLGPGILSAPWWRVI